MASSSQPLLQGPREQKYTGEGYFFGSPHHKDYSSLGVILGFPYSGQPPDEPPKGILQGLGEILTYLLTYLPTYLLTHLLTYLVTYTHKDKRNPTCPPMLKLSGPKRIPFQVLYLSGTGYMHP